jgi:hypothetical protein
MDSRVLQQSPLALLHLLMTVGHYQGGLFFYWLFVYWAVSPGNQGTNIYSLTEHLYKSKTWHVGANENRELGKKGKPQMKFPL